MPKFNFFIAKEVTTTEDYQQLKSVQPRVSVQEFTIAAVRSEGTTKTIDAKDDDVVIMQMSNDIEWHYRADEFETFLKQQPGTRRGGEKNDELEVPSFFISQGSNRGGAEEMIKTKGLRLITGMVAKGAAQLLVDKMEKTLDTGLHGLNENMEFIAFDKNKAVKDKPYLLFIHGTNSNTDGGFCELKKNNAYGKLFKFYEGRVLAFEHKTLSESPLKNVADLITALPDEVVLEVVSHSRGGIIADLLSRCGSGGKPFDAAEMAIINSNKEFAALKEEAKAANKAADGKAMEVKKLVRVACPAAGTVLIDNRMDNVVNVLCNLLKLIPGAAACMPFTLFLDFVKAVVHERTDINVFPGVAAQIPGSPLIRMLNNPNRTIQGELFVISGDVESSGILKTMLVMSTNLYFGEAHDLVVNSNSMFKGTYRGTVVREHFEQEPSVNHFNYFKNNKSQDALLAALTDPKKIDSFYEILGISKDIVIAHKRGEVSGKKPAVFILPGIMGSNLEDAKEHRLWVNFIGIATGVLSKLHINSTGITAADVNGCTYNSLINYLSDDFDVYPFPYDWRMNLNDAADKLAKQIKDELKNSNRTNKEFHFIAHSMGGLVFRAMIQRNKALWNEISASKKTKVLMMGVPNNGSYGTIRILLGKDSVIKKLALLDFAHSKETLLQLFKEYPGLVQLLPTEAEGIFEDAKWKLLEKANNEFTAIPPKDTLKQGLDFYTAISNTNYDNDIFRYIAGQDDSTPESYSVEDGKIVFKATAQGDGRVLWSTIPSALAAENIYYVPADHGGIPKYERAFEGYKQLLQKGKSSVAALSNAKPFTRSGAGNFNMIDSDIVVIPTAAELEETIMSGKESKKKTVAKGTIQIFVTNADLVHSKYPVVVGHFKGDGIVQAEKYLDKALDFKLSEYHLVNNYPGEVGTHLIILNDNNNSNMTCKGGVVAGLGEFGTLTEARLLLSLTQAFLTLAIKFTDLQQDENESKEADFGISTLLIGSDFAGLRIITSIKAILQAVQQANEKLEAMGSVENMGRRYKKIKYVEIVELYLHKSIQSGRIIKGLLEEDGFSNFRFMPPVIKKGSGAKRIIQDDNMQETWHRLEIALVENKLPGTKTDKSKLPIRFTAITDKAHADQELVPANRLIVEALIEKVAKQSLWNKSFSQTLYELLIPNGFKGYGSSLRNLVLILDEQTARYPWELLHDANGISEKPLVINTGIIRQLKSGNQRIKVVMNSSSRALVIGEPLMLDKTYPPLPGAKAEAEKVWKVLAANGLAVTGSINEDETEIVPKLLTKSYKIIHIASHGIVGDTEDEQTGVVLGDKIVFTAGDFNSMPVVPEFVFINCCSSNDYSIAVADKMRKKYNLAASVGTQLIQMGVKAAIVTGWEIDDAAAATFCDTFYHSMFEGNTFGDALCDAREKTFNGHPQTNTWGAYQCYGDPFYTFKTIKTAWKKQEFYFVDVEEAVLALDNLLSEMASVSKRKSTKENEEKIDGIIAVLQPEWKTNGRIVERQANCYQAINLIEKALACYEKLFAEETANYTVKAVEQYYSVVAKIAHSMFKQGTISKAAAEKTIKGAIAGIEKIAGITSERYCLIASCWRRMPGAGSAHAASLINAAKYYRKAYEHKEAISGVIDNYPFFNWLHFSILLSAFKTKNKHLQIMTEVEAYAARAIDYAQAQENKVPDFDTKTAKSAWYVFEILSGTTKAAIDTAEKNIVVNFKDAWKRDGMEEEKVSFINYVEMFIGLVDDFENGNKLHSAKTSALKKIITQIKEVEK